MASTILLLFKDEKLKELLDIPEKDRNNLALFRDKYCTQGFGTSELVSSDLPVRIQVYWSTSARTNTTRVFLRTLTFDVYVQRSQIYNALPKDVPLSALRRRQDLISERLRNLLNRKRIEGFLFAVEDEYDANSNTLDYSRKFIDFDIKHIY